MARKYKRDAKGRFAGVSAAKGRPKPSRSVEGRLDRSANVVLGNDRKATGMKPGNAAKRRAQHKQALANYYSKLSPASQKKAVKKISAYRLFN